MAVSSSPRPRTTALLERKRLGAAMLIACVVAIGGLALALRLPGALHNAFWHDEVYSARVLVTGSPVSAVRQVEHTESSPPGWYLLAWLLHHAGLGVSDVRILSAASGALTAALVVLLARRFMPLWAAAFAGLMSAAGYELVYQGQQLRCYALLVLMAVATAIALLRAAEWPSTSRLAEVVACVGIGAYTHYFFGFVVLAALVWVVTSTAGLVRRRLAAGIMTGTALLLPWVPAFLDQHGRASYRFGIGRFRPGAVLTSYPKMFFASLPNNRPLREAAVLGLLAAILGGAVLLWRQSASARLCALLATLPVVASACLWLGGEPIFNVRNVLAAGPFAAVCVAALLVRLGRYAGPAVALLCVLLLVPGVVRADVGRTPIPFDTVAHALASEGWTSADPIITPAGMNWWVPLRWYLPRPAPGGNRAGGGDSCEAVFVITSARRFPESRVLGAPGGTSVDHRVAGRYLILRVPRGVAIVRLPRDERTANVHCTMSGLPAAVRARLGLT